MWRNPIVSRHFPISAERLRTCTVHLFARRMKLCAAGRIINSVWPDHPWLVSIKSTGAIPASAACEGGKTEAIYVCQSSVGLHLTDGVRWGWCVGVKEGASKAQNSDDH